MPAWQFVVPEQLGVKMMLYPDMFSSQDWPAVQLGWEGDAMTYPVTTPSNGPVDDVDDEP